MALVTAASVFQIGKLSVAVVTKDPSNESSSPPKSLLVVSPTEAGTYPVVLFLHGFFLLNSSYSQLLKHVASHGFIVVAPQLYTIVPSSSEEDVASAAAVTNWLPRGLQSLLPQGVRANLLQLALAGHSRGGHAAFSLALGYAQTTVKFSVLVGIDPVAGSGKSSQVPPKILTYVPSSFDLDFPVLVVGTGLGSQKKNILFPPCAPEGVNHDEFYRECRPPCYHFVVKEYGHLDMLDDNAPTLPQVACKSGSGTKDVMRRATGGVVTAVLKACLGGEQGILDAIIQNPGLAPTTLDPVSYRREPVASAGTIPSRKVIIRSRL